MLSKDFIIDNLNAIKDNDWIPIEKCPDIKAAYQRGDFMDVTDYIKYIKKSKTYVSGYRKRISRLEHYLNPTIEQKTYYMDAEGHIIYQWEVIDECHVCTNIFVLGQWMVETFTVYPYK